MTLPPAPGTTSAKPLKARKMTISSGVKEYAQKIVIYGTGGVGKTELASLLKEVKINPLFIDIEEGSNFLDIDRLEPTPQKFEELLEAVDVACDTDSVNAIVIDTLTKAQELAKDFVVRTIPNQKGVSVDSIEGYGWGEGYIHMYEVFLTLLQRLDKAARRGKHIICIAHECTANVPNPSGEDWIRYEPRLSSPKNGKGSIRHRVKEWCDHMFYIGFDTSITQGKAIGGGSRTIYPMETPTQWAKSRSLSKTVIYRRGNAELWQSIFNKKKSK